MKPLTELIAEQQIAENNLRALTNEYQAVRRERETIDAKAFGLLAVNTSKQTDFQRRMEVQKAYIRGLKFATS